MLLFFKWKHPITNKMLLMLEHYPAVTHKSGKITIFDTVSVVTKGSHSKKCY